MATEKKALKIEHSPFRKKGTKKKALYDEVNAFLLPKCFNF